MDQKSDNLSISYIQNQTVVIIQNLSLSPAWAAVASTVHVRIIPNGATKWQHNITERAALFYVLRSEKQNLHKTNVNQQPK